MQIRFTVTAPKTVAREIYRVLEAEFEDDGFPIAITETDETRSLFAVELYVENAAAGDAEERMRHRLAAIAPDTMPVRDDLPDIDWVAKSLEGLKPVRAGRFLVHGAHDRAARRVNDLAIEIEAGLAFGTGHHGTTAGCLEMIDRVVRRERPRNVLDVGTGSGVLAIGVAMLGRIPVLATDIDPVATRVAAANVGINGVAAFVRCVTAIGFAHREVAARRRYDLIVANILARPLMRLAPAMAAHLRPGGSLILSGILTRQRNAVIAAYRGQRFRHVRTLERGEWVTIHFMR